jgi:hypothetical protein
MNAQQLTDYTEDQFKAELTAWLSACSAAQNVGTQTDALMERGNYLWLGSRAVGFDEPMTLMLLGPGLERLRALYAAANAVPTNYASLLTAWDAYWTGEVLVWSRDAATS